MADGTAIIDPSNRVEAVRRKTPVPITVAKGDGIGPEIMDATLRVLDAAGAPLRYDTIEIGRHLYLQGHTSGIAPEAWETIRRNKVLLKAPITTPLGGGYKSLNVTIRKTLNLFANVRPSKSYAPFVASTHPGINLVVVRENEEDLYAGIEHQQTDEVAQVLKLVTRPGSERIIRYAFEYARAYGRRKVTCMTKDNIMKLTDGLFHRVFEEVAAEYPDLESEHQIIDIGAARLAAQPETFDVIVTLNLYGDILSDIASQVSGSVGLAGSANIGDEVAMFEAVHGSAPDIAGKDVANPSGLLLAATQLLVHIGEAEIAERIKNAWLSTLESGIHTADIYREGLSGAKSAPRSSPTPSSSASASVPASSLRSSIDRVGLTSPPSRGRSVSSSCRAADAFVDWAADDRNPNTLGSGLPGAAPAGWELKMITNRGVKVFPDGLPETFCTDHWRCRFVRSDGGAADFSGVLELLGSLDAAGYDVIKTEHLYTFDGEQSYSLGPGS